MKLISFIVTIFAAQLPFGVQTAPQLPQLPQFQISFPSTGRPEQITAQSVNSGIAFTQNFFQLLGSMFSTFNNFVPRIVGMFTQQNPGAIAPAAPALPSLPSVPGLNALPNGFNSRLQPEKVNIIPNAETQNPKRDVEPVEPVENDIAVDKILF